MIQWPYIGIWNFLFLLPQIAAWVATSYLCMHGWTSTNGSSMGTMGTHWLWPIDISQFLALVKKGWICEARSNNHSSFTGCPKIVIKGESKNRVPPILMDYHNCPSSKGSELGIFPFSDKPIWLLIHGWHSFTQSTQTQPRVAQLGWFGKPRRKKATAPPTENNNGATEKIRMMVPGI